MADVRRSSSPNHGKAPRPEPVRRRGAPFFDQLVESLYSPAQVRQTLHRLLREQYGEADRVASTRRWGGAQPHGNDRYQYSLEQQRPLSKLLPGAKLERPQGSLIYRIAGALVYPYHYGSSAEDCPTDAKVDGSTIQAQLANGLFYNQLSLFDSELSTPQVVVWLLFTGNHVESGPLSAYLAKPGGRLPDGRITWPRIEPLLETEPPTDDLPPTAAQAPPSPDIAPEPTLPIRLLPT